jgi:peptidoglycan/LPS O-acetylase OafA/YrhL
MALLSAGVVTWVATYGLCVSANPSRVSTGAMALGHSLTAVASAVILLSVLGSSNGLLRNRTLLYLGKISYGLYVLHEFAHFCAQRMLPAGTPLRVIAQSALALALTVLLAAASYRWLESPFLRLKERFAHVQSRPV